MHSLGAPRAVMQHRVSGSILCPLAQPKKAIGLEPHTRMMVGTEANGWLAQLRNEWCRDRCMKPLKGDQQLRSVSLSYSVALQALKPKSSPRRRRGLDASTDRGLTERSGEVFSLDILSHRMSVMGIFRHLLVAPAKLIETYRFSIRSGVKQIALI